jgi:hypothetical protein
VKTSDPTRHTIVMTGLICSLGSFALCGFLWLGSAFGLVKRSTLYLFNGLTTDPPVHLMLDLVVALVGGMIAGLVIGGVAKMFIRPRRQTA